MAVTRSWVARGAGDGTPPASGCLGRGSRSCSYPARLLLPPTAPRIATQVAEGGLSTKQPVSPWKGIMYHVSLLIYAAATPCARNGRRQWRSHESPTAVCWRRAQTGGEGGRYNAPHGLAAEPPSEKCWPARAPTAAATAVRQGGEPRRRGLPSGALPATLPATFRRIGSDWAGLGWIAPD